MPDSRPAYRAYALILATLALAGCSGTGGSMDWLNSSSSKPSEPGRPSAPPVNLAGLWMLSQPGRGQCRMTFGSAAPSATEGTIAPQGGCPGKFFTSRKWTYDESGLTMHDHNGQPLAQLSSAGATFEGKATTGEPVTLLR